MVTEIAPQPLVIPDSTLPYPTADDIIAAFRVTGLKPTRGRFFLWGEPASCFSSGTRIGACAIGALAYQRAGDSGLARGGVSRAMQDVSGAWQIGVVDGFDGTGEMQSSAEYIAGRATGQAVARWAFGEPQ